MHCGKATITADEKSQKFWNIGNQQIGDKKSPWTQSTRLSAQGWRSFTLLRDECLEHMPDYASLNEVVITGGSSNLEGICELASAVLEVPCNKGKFGSALQPSLRYQEFATALGLLEHARMEEEKLSRKKRAGSPTFSISDMLANSQIKIIGVGGAGISVINDIADESLDGAILAAIDTDDAALSNCKAERKISLVENGEGSGGDTSISKEAAVAHAHEIETLAKGARLIILIAGLGGGTGSVIAPMISKIAGENPECTVVSFADYAAFDRGNTARRSRIEGTKLSLETLPSGVRAAKRHNSRASERPDCRRF